MNYLIIILASYLIGSIPFSHIFPRLKGKDVMKAGTKNVGATNVLVVAGPLMGALAFIGDIAKGYLAVALAIYFFPNLWLATLAGLSAILGHVFSIFLRFKGGKGLATTFGGLLAFDPIFALIAFLVWILLILITRYFILSSLINVAGIVVMLWILGKNIEVQVYSVAAFALLLYTHRQDIARLISGREMNTAQSIKHFFKK